MHAMIATFLLLLLLLSWTTKLTSFSLTPSRQATQTSDVVTFASTVASLSHSSSSTAPIILHVQKDNLDANTDSDHRIGDQEKNNSNDRADGCAGGAGGCASTSLLQDLQNQLDWIQALENRNAAQLDSFVDQQDQWDSLEPWERELLLQKESILQQYHDHLIEAENTEMQ